MTTKIDQITVPVTRVEGTDLNYQALADTFKIFSVQANNAVKMPNYKLMATQQKLASLITLFSYYDSNSKRRLLLVFDKDDATTAYQLNKVFEENFKANFNVNLLNRETLYNYIHSMSLTNQYNFLLNIMPNYMQNHSFSLDTLQTYGTAFNSNFYLQRIFKSKKGKLIDKNGAYHFYNLYFVAGDSKSENNTTFFKLRETAFYPIKVKDISKKKFLTRSKFQIVDSRLEIVDTNSLDPDDTVYINSPQAIGDSHRGDKPKDSANAVSLSIELDTRLNAFYNVLKMMNNNMDKFLNKPLEFSNITMKHISDFTIDKDPKIKLPDFHFIVDISSIKPFLVENFDLDKFKKMFTKVLTKANAKIKEKKAALWNNFNFEFIDKRTKDSIDEPMLMLVPNFWDIEKGADDPYFWDTKMDNIVQHIDIQNLLHSQRGSHKYNFSEKKKPFVSNSESAVTTSVLELFYKVLRKEGKLPAYVDNSFANLGYMYVKLTTKGKRNIKKNSTLQDMRPIKDNFWIVVGYVDDAMKWHELTYRDIVKDKNLFSLAVLLVQKFLNNHQSNWLIYDVKNPESFAFIKNTQMGPLYQRTFYNRQRTLNKPFSSEEVMMLLDGINDSNIFEFAPNFESFKQDALTYVINSGGSINAEQLKQLLLSRIDIDGKLIVKKNKKKLSRLRPELNQIARNKINRDIYISRSNKDNQLINEVGGLIDINYVLSEDEKNLLYCAGTLNPKTEIEAQPVIYSVEGDAAINRKYLKLLKSLLSQLVRFGQTSVINVAQKYVLQSCYDAEYRAHISEKYGSIGTDKDQ